MKSYFLSLAAALGLLALGGCATHTTVSTYSGPPAAVATEQDEDISPPNENVTVTLDVWPAGVPVGVVFYPRYYPGCDCILTVYNYGGVWYNAYAPGVALYVGGWVFVTPSYASLHYWHHNGYYRGDHRNFHAPYRAEPRSPRGPSGHAPASTPSYHPAPAPAPSYHPAPAAPAPSYHPAPAAPSCKWNPVLKRCV